MCETFMQWTTFILLGCHLAATCQQMTSSERNQPSFCLPFMGCSLMARHLCAPIHLSENQFSSACSSLTAISSQIKSISSCTSLRTDAHQCQSSGCIVICAPVCLSVCVPTIVIEAFGILSTYIES